MLGFFIIWFCKRVLVIFFGSSWLMIEREKERKKKNLCIDNNEIWDFYCSCVVIIERKIVMV